MAVLLTDPFDYAQIAPGYDPNNSHLCCAAGHINWQQDGSKPLTWIIHPKDGLIGRQLVDS